MTRGLVKSGIIIGLAIAITVAIVFSMQPKSYPAHAQAVGLPYGGLRLFTLTCTCSANLLEYILDFTDVPPKPPTVIFLVYQPGVSVLHREFNPYGLYLLGDYLPGAGACLIYVGTACSQVPSIGMMGTVPGSGTSP